MSSYTIQDGEEGTVNIAIIGLSPEHAAVIHNIHSQLLFGGDYNPFETKVEPAVEPEVDRWLKVPVVVADHIKQYVLEEHSNASLPTRMINSVKFVRAFSKCGLIEAKYWYEENILGYNKDDAFNRRKAEVKL